MIQAIFFDLNGVIIDDEPIHLRAYREVLNGEGVALSDEDYFASLGMDDPTFVRAAFERARKPLTNKTMHEVIARELTLHRELISYELPVSAGVVTFIKAASRRYQLGVVSMAQRIEVNYVLDLAAVATCFTVVIAGEDAPACKPDPGAYQLALERLNEKRRDQRRLPLLPAECLVIEDSPPGIQAGRAAGMRTIGVTNTVSETALRNAGAEVVTANLADWSLDAVHHLFD
ncbi:MAG TPA: HAD family phosphatase [Pyrinomonadaceae bacterium]|jgi:phosphoglycolate phosphatase/beta-phosphoglucomutase